MGYEDAAKVFLASVDYAVKGAHRFGYRWPVFYDTRTFKVLKAEIAPGKGGERDIPGLYTHVMLQAWELSHESKYLREAECAAQYLKGEGFNLLYQTNNTIFSAIALARLWRVTHQSIYLELSRICVANVVARLWMWNCSYGSAKRYDTFMGVGPASAALSPPQATRRRRFHPARRVQIQTNHSARWGSENRGPIRHPAPRRKVAGRKLRWRRRTADRLADRVLHAPRGKGTSDESRSWSRAVSCCGSCMLTRAATRACRCDDRGAARKTRVTGGCFRLRLPRNDWIYQSAIRLEISRSIFSESP